MFSFLIFDLRSKNTNVLYQGTKIIILALKSIKIKKNINLLIEQYFVQISKYHYFIESSGNAASSDIKNSELKG